MRQEKITSNSSGKENQKYLKELEAIEVSASSSKRRNVREELKNMARMKSPVLPL
jgi:hypothetical protein